MTLTPLEDVRLLDAHAALAAPNPSHQHCAGSGAPAVRAYRTGTYIAIARCITCGHRVRVKADGNLRAHQGAPRWTSE